MGLGLAITAAGFAARQGTDPEQPSTPEVDQRSRDMVDYYETEIVPRIPERERARHRARTNFDPLLPKNPTSLFGFTVGDWVSINLYTYQGVGQIVGIESEDEARHATKVFPVFGVHTADGPVGWFGVHALEHCDQPGVSARG